MISPPRETVREVLKMTVAHFCRIWLGKVLKEVFLDLRFPLLSDYWRWSIPWQYGVLRLAMEERHSVSSPRGTLRVSRKREPGVTFVDSEDRVSGFGLSEEHGPKTSEAYGFVGFITTTAATGLYFCHLVIFTCRVGCYLVGLRLVFLAFQWRSIELCGS